MPPTREGRTPPPPFPKDRPDKFGKAPPPAARGAWILTVHHNAGSLEAMSRKLAAATSRCPQEFCC